MYLLKFVVSRYVIFDEYSKLDPRKVSLELSRNEYNEQVGIPVDLTKERDEDTQFDESKDADLEELASNEPYTIVKERDKR